MLNKDKWEQGLPSEVAFWDDWLAGRTKYAEDRALRLSSGRAFPWWAKLLLPDSLESVRVLDVGAGPVTALGDLWPGKTVEIVPVDPLAETYQALLDRYAIDPPVKTKFGVGEKLVEQFGPESFDFAYACNCLDHAIDPVECYNQMLAVLRPGCSLVTFHEANEGEHQNYEGLHQWNFSVEKDRLIVWNKQGQRDVFDLCDKAVSFKIEGDRKYIKFTMTKQG